jgi:polysaccharide biosynthesis/export protein
MTHKALIRWLLILSPVVIFSLSSCRVLFPNNMLTTKKDYPFDTLKLDSATFATEYRLAPDDVIEFRLFANDGFKMIDLIAVGQQSSQNLLRQGGFEYTLDSRGEVKLPILGLVRLDSMTLRETETYLETRYADYYVNPFAIVKVVNRRVIVYPGEPGNARVIQLANNNTTVLEAIALAGGISANGKAHKISLIRQSTDPNNPLVYRIDLSRMENIGQGNIVLQSNDIIYVEPRKRYASKTLQEVAPVMSLISAAITVYVLLARL